MIEAGHRLHFVEELLPARVVGERFATEHFEGDDPTVFRMPRFEHLAQAALAEPIEHVIRADDQILTAAREKLIDLEHGQPAALYELFREIASRGMAVRQARQLFELLGFEEGVLSQNLS
jgi:hypothetical protein